MRNNERAWARRCSLALLSLSVVAAAPVLHAQQSADGDLLRRTQMQLRQSEQERNSLRGEVARLQAQLDAQRGEFDRLRTESAQAQEQRSSAVSELAARNNRLSQATQSLRDTQEELEDLRAENARRTHALSNLQGLLDNAQQKLALREELVGLCRSRNEQLFKIGQELVTMYRDKQFNSFVKREPVLQIQQVKLQNAMQDFEDRLRSQRVYEDTLPPSVEQKMQESLSGTSSHE